MTLKEISDTVHDLADLVIEINDLANKLPFDDPDKPAATLIFGSATISGTVWRSRDVFLKDGEPCVSFSVDIDEEFDGENRYGYAQACLQMTDIINELYERTGTDETF